MWNFEGFVEFNFSEGDFVVIGGFMDGFEEFFYR